MLLLLAALMRWAPTNAPDGPVDGVSMWGIRPGMRADEVVQAFGRAPAEKRTYQGREVWIFGREHDLQDAVVMFDGQGKVEAVRGSVVEVQGKRFYLPLSPRQAARLLGESRLTGDEQRWYPEQNVGLQYRSVMLSVHPASGQVKIRDYHATMAWLGDPHSPVLTAH